MDILTGTTETNGGRTHTQVLRDLDKGVGHLRRVGTLGLGTDWGDLGAGGLHDGGCALHGVEGGSVAGGSYIEIIVNGAAPSGSSVLELSSSPRRKLTRVCTSELLELSWASDLGGALSGHGGHLWDGHAERRGHCDGFDGFDGLRDGAEWL